MKIEYIFTNEDMGFYLKYWWICVKKYLIVFLCISTIMFITSLAFIIYDIYSKGDLYKIIFVFIISSIQLIFQILLFYIVRNQLNKNPQFDDENVTIEINNEELIEQGKEEIDIIKIIDIKKIIMRDQFTIVECKKKSIVISNHAFESKLQQEIFLRLLKAKNNKIKYQNG